MNYRHAYHAGNFADVVKHLALLSVIKSYLKKEKAFYILDSFAGIGEYDLSSDESKKTNEAELGIVKIYNESNKCPDLLEEYLQFAGKYLKEQNHYPGSPLIISSYLREVDKADFCELHPHDFHILKRNLRNIQNSFCHNIDGHLSFKSLLPPKLSRGIVFIDPAFEDRKEFEKIIDAVNTIQKKFSHACTIIWYPIKDYKLVKKFYESLMSLSKEILKIEFSLPSSNVNLTSAGLVIINPPLIKENLETNLKFLKERVYEGKAEYSVSFLSKAI